MLGFILRISHRMRNNGLASREECTGAKHGRVFEPNGVGKGKRPSIGAIEQSLMHFSIVWLVTRQAVTHPCRVSPAVQVTGRNAPS